jgi:hypothetical protein
MFKARTLWMVGYVEFIGCWGNKFTQQLLGNLMGDICIDESLIVKFITEK